MWGLLKEVSHDKQASGDESDQECFRKPRWKNSLAQKGETRAQLWAELVRERLVVQPSFLRLG